MGIEFSFKILLLFCIAEIKKGEVNEKILA